MNASLLLPLLLSSQPGFEDLNQLNARLADASGNRAVALDPRLRLVRCPEPALIAPDVSGSLVVHCPATGWRLRVAMTAARIGSDAASPILIQRGESVAVAIRGNDFTLSYQAVATEPGRKGDAVRVKFSSSGKVLVATVTGHGRVEIRD